MTVALVRNFRLQAHDYAAAESQRRLKGDDADCRMDIRHMNKGLARSATRIAYGSAQLPRLAWYTGLFHVMRQLAREVQFREQGKLQPQRRSNARLEKRLNADIAMLLEQDLANVEAGIYPIPFDRDGSFSNILERLRLFFLDLPEIHERRKRHGTHEVLSAPLRGRRPDYYLQNFHYQSGGWETDDSAARYDTQVEVLFRGTANMMRRQALPPLAEAFEGRDQRKMRLIDIGCGTGRFVDSIKQAWPRLPITGIDLSEAYIRHARRYLKQWPRTHVLVANGEAIPAPDKSYDAATCIFLMHELPPRVRRTLIAEVSRVLKPGGRLVLLDSLQFDDEPEYNSMLEDFPKAYHEPYFSTYLNEDFATIAGSCGLAHRADKAAYLSKIMVFDKEPN